MKSTSVPTMNAKVVKGVASQGQLSPYFHTPVPCLLVRGSYQGLLCALGTIGREWVNCMMQLMWSSMLAG